MNFKIISLVSLTTLAAASAPAALHRVEPVLLPPPGTELAWMSDGAYEQAKTQAAERASRSISAALEISDALSY